MIRALIELLFTIAIVLVARIVLMRLMRGVMSVGADMLRNSNGAATGGGSGGGSAAQGQLGGAMASGEDLHKDPVCGTYVAESTPFRSAAGGGQVFYYCSAACREKHALVAR